MKIKKDQQVFNFGATSEFAKKILKRASEKLNPVKIDGAVSEHAKSYLATFSNWATSQIISDELKKYQLPLPTGHQSSCPDAAGLKATEIQNGLFDKALQQAVLELREEELAQTNFAEETASNNVGGSFFKDSSGNLRPVNVGLVSAGAAMLGKALTRKKKKKDDDLAFDLAVAGGLGYIGGHGGAMLFNGDPKKEQPKEQPKQAEASSNNTSENKEVSKDKTDKTDESDKSDTKTEEVIPNWFGKDDSDVIYIGDKEYRRLSGKPKAEIEKWLKAHGKDISHFNGRIPIPGKYVSDFSKLGGFPYSYVVDSDGNFHVRRVNGKTRVYNAKDIDERVSSVVNVDSGERMKNLEYLKEYFGENFDPTKANMKDIYRVLGAQWMAIHDDETEFNPDTFNHGIPGNLGTSTFQVKWVPFTDFRYSRMGDLLNRYTATKRLYETGVK